jgi:hypothetical protein
MHKTVTLFYVTALTIGGIQSAVAEEVKVKRGGIAVVHQGEVVVPATGPSTTNETQKRKIPTVGSGTGTSLRGSAATSNSKIPDQQLWAPVRNRTQAVGR